jgi:hypothetical protein
MDCRAGREPGGRLNEVTDLWCPRIGDEFSVYLPERPEQKITAHVAQMQAERGEAGVLLDLGRHGQRWVSLARLRRHVLDLRARTTSPERAAAGRSCSTGTAERT